MFSQNSPKNEILFKGWNLSASSFVTLFLLQIVSNLCTNGALLKCVLLIIILNIYVKESTLVFPQIKYTLFLFCLTYDLSSYDLW